MTANEKDPLVSSEAGYGTEDAKEETSTPQPLSTRIKETLDLFWYLGFVAFGGPTAHVAILRDHLVTVNKFIDEEIFTELFALGRFQIAFIDIGFVARRRCMKELVNCKSKCIISSPPVFNHFIHRPRTPRSQFYAASYFDGFDSRWSYFRGNRVRVLVSSWIYRAYVMWIVLVQLR